MLNRPKVNADQRRALQLLADAGVQGRTGAPLFAMSSGRRRTTLERCVWLV
jgi:hypothetical protein